MSYARLCIVSMVIAWSIFADSCIAVRIDLDPQTLPAGETTTNRAVTISCSLDAEENSANQIVSIQIVKKGGRVLATARPGAVSSIEYSKLYVDGDVSATGSIRTGENDLLKSFLTLTLKHPDTQDIGTYSCHVTYYDSQSGKVMLNNAKGYLSLEKPEMKDIDKKVKDIQKELENIRKFEDENKTNEKKVIDLKEKAKTRENDIKSVAKKTKQVRSKVTRLEEVTGTRLKNAKALTDKRQGDVKTLKDELNKFAAQMRRDEEELKEIGEKEAEDHWRVKDLVEKAGRRVVGIRELTEKESKLEEKVNELQMAVRNGMKKMELISTTKTAGISKVAVLEAKAEVHETDFKYVEKKESELEIKMSKLEEKMEEYVKFFMSLDLTEYEDEDEDDDDGDEVTKPPFILQEGMESRVAFSASNDNSDLKIVKRKTIVFSKFLLKTEIDVYDAKTGIFTAPVDGIYHFNLIVKADCISCHLQMDMLVNQKKMVMRLKVGVMFDDKQGSASSVVQLKGRDEVKVVVNSISEGVSLSKDGTCVFSGHLVDPL